LCLPVALASTDQPYNLTVTSKYVKATAICSCGASDGDYTTYHTATFLNYCPNCHRYGTLHYSKWCAEGQWTCSACDSDYCQADGKQKIDGSDVYLTRYTIPKAVANNATTQNSTSNKSTNAKYAPVQLTPQQALLNLVSSKLSLNLLF
jgi:hypothetical protein